MSQIDQRILPSPPKLVVIRKPKTDDTAEHSLGVRIGGCEDREPCTLRDADENRLASRCRGSKRRERFDVPRLVRGTKRRCLGREAGQVGLHIEPDDKEATPRE